MEYCIELVWKAIELCWMQYWMVLFCIWKIWGFECNECLMEFEIVMEMFFNLMLMNGYGLCYGL